MAVAIPLIAILEFEAHAGNFNQVAGRELRGMDGRVAVDAGNSSGGAQVKGIVVSAVDLRGCLGCKPAFGASPWPCPIYPLPLVCRWKRVLAPVGLASAHNKGRYL